MTTEQPPSRLQIAQSLAAHFGHRDFDQYIGLLSEDVTYRVDGNHALSGTFPRARGDRCPCERRRR